MQAGYRGNHAVLTRYIHMQKHDSEYIYTRDELFCKPSSVDNMIRNVIKRITKW